MIADRSNDAPEADYDGNGEPIKAFGAKKFWSVLRVEREQASAIGHGVERLVWSLGSTRYLES